ncbi:MAG TPA: efflux transporter outer membrane subunit [Dongiaceae bacterium]|nr:efflux transporter outer membrane subunit [Dongiaceae bacterium]
MNDLCLRAASRSRGCVAQVSNLLYRRLPVGRLHLLARICGLEIRDTADWKSALRLPVTALCALLLAGCSVGPDYQRPPPAPLPARWKAGSPWKEGRPRDAEIKGSFWEIFDDAVLNGLEQQAATNSPDLRAAFERVEESRAIARIARADLLPGVSLDPNGNRTRYSANRTTQPGGPVIGYTGNEFNLPLDLSYEIDLWGRVRRSFRAAREQAQASAAAYRNVLLSLQAGVAQTYFMIRSIDLDRQVLGETVELRKKNLALVESLHRGGADSALDVAQADTELSSAQADLVGLELGRARLENALAVLCGQTASGFSLAQTARLYQPPLIPIGLPADLLERRPDVAQAERSLAAASEAIGIAKAAFFPSIQLTGSAGTESVQLKDVFNWESRAWTIGPNVSFPLFEGGRIRAGVQRAKAAYEEAVALYRSQVLVAFHEVEDGLIGLRLLREQFEDQMRAVDGAKKVSELSRLRYKEGLASYIEVVIADRTMLENQITAYELNGQRLQTTVQLIKALGGGWNLNHPMMTNRLRGP